MKIFITIILLLIYVVMISVWIFVFPIFIFFDENLQLQLVVLHMLFTCVLIFMEKYRGAIDLFILQILEGHTDEIFSCAFNYEGDILLTGEMIEIIPDHFIWIRVPNGRCKI